MSGVLPRIIITAEEAQDELRDLCYMIKVPPLRVRPSDIRAMQAFFLRSIAREKDMDNISLTDEAVRQLEAYSYPLNIAELKTMVERAAAQSDNSGRKLSEDVFWFAKQVGGKGLPARAFVLMCLPTAQEMNLSKDVFWLATQVSGQQMASDRPAMLMCSWNAAAAC
jgi:transcriptional regulator with AAA-type ATPase domain